MAGAVSNSNFFVECGTCGKGFESDAKCDSHLAKVCDLGNCNHKEQQSAAYLKVHQATMHGVAATKYLCSATSCNSFNGGRYESFSSSNVYAHERKVHNITR